MTYLIRSGNVFCSNHGGLWYLMRKNSRHAYVLNSVASYIWDIVQKPTTLSQIVDLISQKYHLEPSAIFPEIQQFTDLLLRKKYIAVVLKRKSLMGF